MSFQPGELRHGISVIEQLQSEGDTAGAMSALDVMVADLEREYEHGGSALRELMLCCQLSRAHEYADTRAMREMLLDVACEYAAVATTTTERNKESASLLRKPIEIPGDLTEDGTPSQIRTKKSLRAFLAQVYELTNQSAVKEKFELSGGKHQRALTFLKRKGVSITEDQLDKYAPKN
jgi:hypothetical protein